MKRFIFGVAAAIFLIEDLYASSILFEPASLKDSEASIERKIKFPRSVASSNEDVFVVIRCDAYIKVSGKLSSNMCYEEGEDHYPYIVQINRAAKKSRFQPGKVDGASKVTYFQYYVVFTKKGPKMLIEVMGNSGLEVERLGVDYTSPQRYSEKTSGFGVGCNLNQKLTVNAVVNKMGKATSVEVIGDSIPERCAETISKYFMRQKYIPAMVNGQAVDAFYSERIFNQMRQH